MTPTWMWAVEQRRSSCRRLPVKYNLYVIIFQALAISPLNPPNPLFQRGSCYSHRWKIYFTGSCYPHVRKTSFTRAGLSLGHSNSPAEKVLFALILGIKVILKSREWIPPLKKGARGIYCTTKLNRANW